VVVTRAGKTKSNCGKIIKTFNRPSFVTSAIPIAGTLPYTQTEFDLKGIWTFNYETAKEDFLPASVPLRLPPPVRTVTHLWLKLVLFFRK